MQNLSFHLANSFSLCTHTTPLKRAASPAPPSVIIPPPLIGRMVSSTSATTPPLLKQLKLKVVWPGLSLLATSRLLLALSDLAVLRLALVWFSHESSRAGPSTQVSPSLLLLLLLLLYSSLEPLPSLPH